MRSAFGRGSIHTPGNGKRLCAGIGAPGANHSGSKLGWFGVKCSRPVSLAVLGDVTDINCHSNLPYFFYTEGKRQGFFTDPVRLNLSLFRWKRRYWNARQFLLGRGIGGYQYSRGFLDALHEQVPAHLFGGLVISFAQTFPDADRIKRFGGEVIYYIDATLRDLANNASYGLQVSKSVLRKALAQEKRNYQIAKYVVTRSSWIIPTLVDFYNVDRSKIRHILPGANLALPEQWTPGGFRGGAGIDRDLVLGFVGKDWKRKGLPFLLDVRDELSRRGYRVVVKVVGHAPKELASRPGVCFTGFIDKQTQMDKFIETIEECDLGCLFSESEALGISVLEFLRVGVPVMGFYHQGLVDTLLEGASLRVPVGDSPAAVAGILETWILDVERQRAIKAVAVDVSSDVTWSRTVENFSRLVSNGGELNDQD